MRASFLVLPLLAACTGAAVDDTGTDTGEPPDLETALLEFVAVQYYDVFRDLHFGVVGDDILYHMVETLGAEEAATTGLEGVSHIPDDYLDGWEPLTDDGEITLDWHVTYEAEPWSDPEDTDNVVHHWYWTIEETIDRLVLPSAQVSGDGSWTVEHEEYDYTLYHHVWTGTLSVDGAAPVAAEWKLPNGGDEDVDGVIDGIVVEWDGTNPMGI